MKSLPIILLSSVCLLVAPAAGQDGSTSSEPSSSSSEFLQRDKWWNLYFDEGNDPLNRPVRAVKVVQLSEKHSSWVRVAFPKDKKEHFSILRPAAEASDDKAIDLDAALAKWENGITEWKTMWINLDFVVHITRVEPSDEPKSRSRGF